jgi:hypothetical protein
LLEQVKGDAPQDSKVLSSIAFADAAIIFSESDIQHPMAAVLDVPMSADGLGKGHGFTRQAGDVVAGLQGGLIALASFCFNHSDASQIAP